MMSSDLFGEMLRALRIQGSLLLRESYRPPFDIHVPSAETLQEYLGVDSESRVVAFHLAESGSFEIRREGAEALVVEAGEMVLGIGGEAHRLAAGSDASALHFHELLPGAESKLYGPATLRGAGETRIDCGALVFQEVRLNPLFAALPKVLHLHHRDEGNPRLREFTALLQAEIARSEPAADYVVERLLEVICAEGIRAHAAERRDTVGWFRGLTDPRVGRALTAFHRRPGDPWSVAALAQEAHLSASRFAARFVEVTGVRAMTYVTRWRMHLALQALAHTQRSLADIAHNIGYESLPAFSRAFKRHVGVPPASYRKQRQGGTEV